jgi:predicted ATPase/DNA-binding SARP family transcriptional activator
VDICVLGPVEVVGEAGAVRLPGLKQRRLLTALVVDAGKTTAVDVLVDAVWHDAPPPSAAKLVQVYVSQLRKVLAEGVRIETRGGGYSLELDPHALDAARFERLLAEGTAARRDGNSELALSLLGRALALWRGAAYGEFAYDDFARAEAERLEELRMVALEERFEAGLALGRHAELLPELVSIAAEQPLRERLQVQAMLALYRCGRQAGALELYSAARARLHDELGLEPGGELREVQRRILQHDPSLEVARAQESSATSLPVPANPLLGRERELAELGELLLRDDVRLLVLTGAGGSGKTRLALETAREMAAWFANGAAFVELAPLRDSSLVIGTIVRTLAIEHVPGEEPIETLTRFLRPRELLLVLDNAEHLHEGTPVLSELLARVRRLTLLVTSRVVLHLSGEHVYPVQPLAQGPAVALFHARARQADAHFASDHEDEQAIGRICARLDGLPLAIELAASRTPTLPPRDLLERLDPRLPLLTGGPRDLPARQQTLRATLEWSFGLLSRDERKLAARLAVFVGSFDLEAATAVCDADLDRLMALVEQSLLQQTAEGHFLYLETIREYALERLLGSAGADEIRRRHFRHFLQLAETADLSAVRRLGRERLDLAAAAWDNLRAALAWSLETGSVALGLELASAMERFWVTHDPREGARWFAALLSRPEAKALAPALRADALRAYGSATDIAGDDEAARHLYEQSLALFEELGDENGRAVLLHRLGINAMRRGDLTRAQGLVESSQHIHERTRNRWGQAQTIGTLGAIARDSGDEQRARALIHSSATMAREAGVRWWESGMLAELATLSLNAGQTDEAETQARESLALAEQIGDRAGRVFGVGLFARIAALRGQQECAQQLWAAVASEDAVAPLGGWRHHRQNFEAQIKRHLGGAVHQPDQTTALALDDAVTLALQSTTRPRSPRRA